MSILKRGNARYSIHLADARGSPPTHPYRYQECLATRECRLDADAFCENSQVLGNSGIRADHILVFLTDRWAKLIQQWGVMDPTQFSFAKHNLADLTNSAALLKRLELQTMRAEMDRERLKFLLKKKGGQSGASDYSESDAEPRYSPFHHEAPAYGEKGRIVGAASVPEARDALQRLAEHPSAPDPEAPEPPESRPPNAARHPSAPGSEQSEPPQTAKNANPIALSSQSIVLAP